MKKPAGDGRPERGLHTPGPDTCTEGKKTQVGGRTHSTADTGRGKPNHHKQQNCAKKEHLDQKQTDYHGRNSRICLTCMYNEPIGKSDHLVLTWTYNSYIQQSLNVTSKRLHNDGNYVKMRSDLKGTDWVNILQDKSVEEQ